MKTQTVMVPITAPNRSFGTSYTAPVTLSAPPFAIPPATDRGEK